MHDGVPRVAVERDFPHQVISVGDIQKLYLVTCRLTNASLLTISSSNNERVLGWYVAVQLLVEHLGCAVSKHQKLVASHNLALIKVDDRSFARVCFFSVVNKAEDCRGARFYHSPVPVAALRNLQVVRFVGHDGIKPI